MAKDTSERLPNLGWLAQSGAQPRKRKMIEGVGGSSIIDMQAQLYTTKERAKLSKDDRADLNDKYMRRKAGVDVSVLMNFSNAGVEKRAELDRLQLKTTADRMTECYAALEKKARIYDKLARGEIDDEDQRYDVDFLRKGEWEHRREDRCEDEDEDASGQEVIDTTGMAVSGSGDMMSEDMARERERRDWEKEELGKIQQEEKAEELRQQRKELIQDLAQQTKEDRRMASVMRDKKEAALAKKRQQLKEAFIKKQMDKYKGLSAP